MIYNSKHSGIQNINLRRLSFSTYLPQPLQILTFLPSTVTKHGKDTNIVAKTKMRFFKKKQVAGDFNGDRVMSCRYVIKDKFSNASAIRLLFSRDEMIQIILSMDPTLKVIHGTDKAFWGQKSFDTLVKMFIEQFDVADIFFYLSPRDSIQMKLVDALLAPHGGLETVIRDAITHDLEFGHGYLCYL